ncbi:MAG: hypothetical protein ACD_55C00137G0001 [uncultured bacterium]|nr:MAG: hypothetical protein ACD_55C00137G0001 [uncultured bacterium]
MPKRVSRDYRKTTPAKFLSFCQKVKRCLTDNPNYPDSVWGGNVAVRQQLFEKVDAIAVSYGLASNGDRILIRERDRLMQEIMTLLDEVAPLLESASVRNPDALLTTGFTISQERRAHSRTPKLPLTSPTDFTVVNSGDPRRAIGSATAMPGALNNEIQLNRKDPSLEEDWFHKAIFPDARNMVMDNLEHGNTFFRMRHHGQDGPGPWSAVMSATIS